jgi:hypothetical protein
MEMAINWYSLLPQQISLIIKGTIFTHKNTHKVTWRSPDGKTMNQIDHILIQKEHSSNLKDVRCKRGVNVDSDTGNTYLIAEVMNFPLHFCYAGVQCLPQRLPAHDSFIPVFVMHVLAVPNPRG